MSLDDQELAQKIQQFGTRHPAPDSLRAGLRAHLALTKALRVDNQTAEAPVHRPSRWQAAWQDGGLRQGALGFVLGLAAMAALPPLVERLAPGRTTEAEIVGHHVHALQFGPLTEVASTDRHTVKPWFQGRLDYAPPVMDLGSEGFPLLGGRIEHFRGNVVAALAYARRNHIVDLYVWPSASVANPVAATYRGYNLVYWSDGAMQYWAVSDLDRPELENFTQRWRERLPAQ